MNNLYKMAFYAMIVTFIGCGADNKVDDDVVSASIVDFTWEECYCCPGVTLDVDGEQLFVEDFPDFELKEEDLPRSVVVELSEYSGECPNKQYSAVYHD